MQIPFTLRLFAYGLRATMRAGLLFLCAWLFLIPASAADNEKLSTPPGTTYPAGLREMRAAQVFVAVAPSQAYVTVGSLVAPNVPPYAIKLGLMQMAAGNLRPATAVPEEEPFSARDIEGPKFIRVD